MPANHAEVLYRHRHLCLDATNRKELRRTGKVQLDGRA